VCRLSEPSPQQEQAVIPSSSAEPPGAAPAKPQKPKVAAGVNEVTRLLERGDAAVVALAMGPKAPAATRAVLEHVPTLARVKVRVCEEGGVGSRVRGRLRTSRVRACLCA
jgi:hypothetical protein